MDAPGLLDGRKWVQATTPEPSAPATNLTERLVSVREQERAARDALADLRVRAAFPYAINWPQYLKSATWLILPTIFTGGLLVVWGVRHLNSYIIVNGVLFSGVLISLVRILLLDYDDARVVKPSPSELSAAESRHEKALVALDRVEATTPDYVLNPALPDIYAPEEHP